MSETTSRKEVLKGMRIFAFTACGRVIAIHRTAFVWRKLEDASTRQRQSQTDLSQGTSRIANRARPEFYDTKAITSSKEGGCLSG